MLHVLIMAGGSGSRFWPRSRRSRPKQLLRFNSDKTLLALTVERVQGLVPMDRIWIVTTQDQEAAIREAVPGIKPGNILIEPCGRDTAACIGLAAVQLLREDPEAVMAVMPSDHYIQPVQRFRKRVEQAGRVAEQSDLLLTFAIRPSFPATGYGYLEKGDGFDNDTDLEVFRVHRFAEKPDLTTARRYLRQGNYFWNAGIFVWRAERILAEIQKYLPVHADLLEKIRDAAGTGRFQRTLDEAYPQFKKVSIDYGVLEPAAHAGQLLMVQADFQWDDVGSWTSLTHYIAPNELGNVIAGTCVAVESQDNIVSGDGKHLVALLGVKDLIVVHTGDATLICPKEKAQEVKKIIAALEDKGLKEYL